MTPLDKRVLRFYLYHMDHRPRNHGSMYAQRKTEIQFNMDYDKLKPIFGKYRTTFMVINHKMPQVEGVL